MFKFNVNLKRKDMSALENLGKRLNYNGGKAQVNRMNIDKLRSLKKALLYSYQSATAILQDGREFRCLINPDQVKNEYDNKIISIPFEDVCLNEDKIGTTSEGIQVIGMKPGDVFTWKENNTDWIVYLQKFEETAYFRAEIRRCKYTTEVNGTTYKVWAGRTSVDEMDWLKVHNIDWNDLDYTLNMYITKDENTEKNLHRFSIIYLNGQPWQVQSVDSMNSDGIIIVYLKEHFKNSIEQEIEKEKKENEEEQTPSDENAPIIEGDFIVYPYDVKTYTIKNAEGGYWVIESPKCEILEQNENQIRISIVTGRSGEFQIIYKRENQEDIVADVTIASI